MGVTRRNRQDKAAKTSQLDYRFYKEHRVPIVGHNQELMSDDEFNTSTVIVGKFGCGVFDIKVPEEKHYDRTLADVFERAGLGEFQIIRFQTIVRGGDKVKPRVYYDIAWVEQRALLSKDLLEHVHE
jgi:hypothetical protein